jgi:hypothetical protein
VVVRRRLTERYTLPADPDVWITHAAVTGCHPVRELELFLVVGGEPVVAQDEQAFNRESHFAMEGTGTPAAMSGIRELLAGAGGLQPDGGGYNPHENAASGGRTLLYFRGVELMGYPWPPRLELVMDGHHASLLARHEQTAGVTL